MRRSDGFKSPAPREERGPEVEVKKTATEFRLSVSQVNPSTNAREIAAKKKHHLQNKTQT